MAETKLWKMWVPPDREKPEPQGVFWSIYIVDENSRQVAQVTGPTDNDTKHFVDLIIAAVNACKKVNEQSPMAVAESIGEAFETLTKVQPYISSIGHPGLLKLINKALANAGVASQKKEV